MKNKVLTETANEILILKADLEMGKITFGRFLMLGYRLKILHLYIKEQQSKNLSINIQVYSYLQELNNLRVLYFSTT